MEHQYSTAFRSMLDEARKSSDPRVHRLALQLLSIRMAQRIDSQAESILGPRRSRTNETNGPARKER